MPTALTDLPGYQGNPRVFAHDHVRDLAGGAADDDDALLAAVSQRVAQLSANQVDQLHALSPQARKLRLRVWLNPVAPARFNAWTADERAEQLQWRGSGASTAFGRRQRWSAWYGFAFDADGRAQEDAEEQEIDVVAAEGAPAAAPAAVDAAAPVPTPPPLELTELCRRAGLDQGDAELFFAAGLSVAVLESARSMTDLALFCPPTGDLAVASVAKAFTAVREQTKDAKAKAEGGADLTASLRPLQLGAHARATRCTRSWLAPSRRGVRHVEIRRLGVVHPRPLAHSRQTHASSLPAVINAGAAHATIHIPAYTHLPSRYGPGGRLRKAATALGCASRPARGHIAAH